MAQKPIRLEQLGISLDDIIIHLQDKAIIQEKIVEKEIVKEIDPALMNRLIDKQLALRPTMDEETVNKLVAKRLALQPAPAPTINENDIKKIINKEIVRQELTKPEVTKQSVNEMITEKIANIPTIAPVNRIVEKIDEQAVRYFVAEELRIRAPAPPSILDEKTVEKLVVAEFDKRPEVTTQIVNQLIADEIARQELTKPEVTEQSVNQMIANEITRQELTKPEVNVQSVNQMIAEQIANIPEFEPINTVVETVDEEAVKYLVAKHLRDNALILDEKTVTEIVIAELDKIPTEQPEVIIAQPEMTAEVVNQLVADEITRQELTKPEVDVQSVNKMIAEQIANIPVVAPINTIAETIDEAAVNHLVTVGIQEYFNRFPQTSTTAIIDEQVVIDLVAIEVQKHLPEPEPIAAPEPVPVNLDEHKVWAKQEIDEVASTIRAKTNTIVPGQEALYAEKVDEATDYIADGATELSTFPLLRAEVNGTGKTTDEVVDGILARKSQWIAVNAQIEEIRLRAKMNIGSATTDEEVETIKNQAITSLQAV